MDKYIERDELISTIKRIYCDDCRNYDGARCRACETNDVLCLIEDAPSAEVEPVVHCKDCIGKSYWYKNNYGCTICGLSGLFVVEDNDFCSYGERKN